MPAIAVLIAAKDAGAFLRTCLDSVLCQLLPDDWEMRVVLGVDGCDATAVVASSYSDTVMVRCSNRSVGPYIIFNSLVALTNADVLCRFDADDVMLPGYLSSHVQQLTCPMSADIVRSWSIYTDINLNPARAMLSDGTFTCFSGKRRRGSDGQFTMTRAVWARLGGFRPWRFNADSEFLTRARGAGFSIADVPRYSYLRRVHPSSLTANPRTGYASQQRQYYESFTARQREAFGQGATVPQINPRCEPMFGIETGRTRSSMVSESD